MSHNEKKKKNEEIKKSTGIQTKKFLYHTTDDKMDETNCFVFYLTLDEIFSGLERRFSQGI